MDVVGHYYIVVDVDLGMMFGNGFYTFFDNCALCVFVHFIVSYSSKEMLFIFGAYGNE